MTDEERQKLLLEWEQNRHRLEYDTFYAQQTAEKWLAGVVLVAIVLGVVLGIGRWIWDRLL